MTRPPNDRGQGRKPLSGSEPTTSMTIRLTKTQREKLRWLGGAQWVRDKIDRAKEKA
jgi:hypothetical protein